MYFIVLINGLIICYPGNFEHFVNFPSVLPILFLSLVISRIQKTSHGHFPSAVVVTEVVKKVAIKSEGKTHS